MKNEKQNKYENKEWKIKWFMKNEKQNMKSKKYEMKNKTSEFTKGNH